MKRKTPLRKRNPSHRKAAFARAYGGDERVEWVQRQPCVVCGAAPCENAHTRSGGMGRKSDARWVVPMCHMHHAILHSLGQKSFEEHYDGIDLHWWAQLIDARWDAYVATRDREAAKCQP